MARVTRRPPATQTLVLSCLNQRCPVCEGPMWFAYEDFRKISTLDAVLGVTLQVRRCVNAGCEGYHRPYRPEQEGKLALPHHEFGLDVIAWIGARRYQDSCSLPEIHRDLQGQGVVIAARTVDHLLARYAYHLSVCFQPWNHSISADFIHLQINYLVSFSEGLTLRFPKLIGGKARYEELVSVALEAPARRATLRQQGRLILALDGLQPDKGHEVLWVVREVLSGEILIARSLLVSGREELSGLLREALVGLEGVPVKGVISDGQLATVACRILYHL